MWVARDKNGNLRWFETKPSRDWGEYDLNYYFCDACRYCFSAEKLPDRCPDCGAVAHDNKKAVRPASKTEIEELLKIQKEDKENIQNEST